MCSSACDSHIDGALISPELLVAAMQDRARVNDVAMRTLSVIYNNMMVLSHILDWVGDKMTTPILDDFIN